MKRVVRIVFIPAIVSVLSVATGLAQEAMMKMPGGVRGSYMKLSHQAEEQILSLAEAVPQDKFGWRPMEGVRSLSESFLHAATGNYVILKVIGGTLPEGVDPMKNDMSTTNKEAIVKEVKRSFKMLGDRVAAIDDSELSREVDFFGNKMTVGDMITFAVAHQRETLGQEIAYARMNNIVPPWTMARTKEMEKKKAGTKM